MNEFQRLLGYVRPYRLRLALSVLLMAGVGVTHGLIALLVGPVFDRALKPAGPEAPVALFKAPLTGAPVYLNDFVPSAIHNEWTMIALAILVVFLLRGLFDYCGNYLVNYVGLAAVTDLRQTVFDKVLRHGAEFFESHSTGRLMSSIMNDIDKIQVATSHILADLLRQCFVVLVSVVRAPGHGLEAGNRQPDPAAVRAGAHGAHRPADPAHHAPRPG